MRRTRRWWLETLDESKSSRESSHTFTGASNQKKQPQIAEVNDGVELDNGDTEREERREMEVNGGRHVSEASLSDMLAIAAAS